MSVVFTKRINETRVRIGVAEDLSYSFDHQTEFGTKEEAVRIASCILRNNPNRVASTVDWNPELHYDLYCDRSTYVELSPSHQLRTWDTLYCANDITNNRQVIEEAIMLIGEDYEVVLGEGWVSKATIIEIARQTSIGLFKKLVSKVVS